MFLSLARLAHYGFNRHPLTLEDFYQICVNEQITVLHEDIASSFYMVVDHRRFIVLAKHMNWLKRLYVAYHELHHALLGPEQQTRACFFGLVDTPEERNANSFATIAIIPRHMVGHRQIIDDCCCGVAQAIFDERMRLFTTYGI
jgi:Zn-dependent peptidase ImmA (M78 family)